MLTRVTFTGLDDNTNIDDLLALEKEFAHINIEWGILFSAKRGTDRYPSPYKVNEALSKLKNCSAHLCGAVFDNFYNNPFGYNYGRFKRIQLNFNTRNISALRLSTIFKMYPEKEFILQYNKSNKDVIEYLTKYKNTNWTVLFDSSGGHGVSVQEWPKPLEYVACSYAGGLGPHNLGVELPRICDITGELPFGIDMEGQIRTDNKFDVHKVKQVLEIVSEQIKK